MDRLVNSLVPNTVRQACSASRSHQPKVPLPCCIECSGAVAIIDLSGYTNLTEKLFNSGGSNGGERVYDTVNPFFEGIINICEEFHGDVIKFCGDALIVVWPVFVDGEEQTVKSSEHETDALARALACSLRVVRQFGSYKVSLDDNMDESSIDDRSVSINPSKVSWDKSMVGNLLVNRNSGVSKISQGDGEIVLGVHMASILPSIVSRNCLLLTPSPHLEAKLGTVFAATPSLQIPPSDILISIDSQVENFVMESALGRLKEIATFSATDIQNTIQRQASELRTIIVLFIKINSVALKGTTEEQSAFAQEVFKNICELLHKFHGHLRQIVYDDKGFTALVVWGLPPSSSMDERHALSCSLHYRDYFESMSSVDFAIGVSEGICYTGIIGSNLRQDYNLFGRCVNLAARCMTSPNAHQTILCDGFYFGLAADKFRFGNQIPTQLKGVNEKRDLRVLLGEKRGRLTMKPMKPLRSPADHADTMEKTFLSHIIGREREVQTIFEAIEAWDKRGQQTLIIIQGNSGVGKTTLATVVEEKLTQQIEERKVFLLEGQGAEMTKQHAFSAFLSQVIPQLISSLYDIVDTLQGFSIPKFNLSLQDQEFIDPGATISTSTLLKNEDLKHTTSSSNQTTPISHYAAKICEALNISERLLPLFNVMEGCDFPETEEIRLITAAGKRGLFRQLLHHILTVVFDCLKIKIVIMWLDSKSHAFFNQLRATWPQFLYVVCSRPAQEYSQGDHFQLRNLCEDARATTISLEEQILQKPAHNSLSQHIFEKTSGIPLVVNAMIRNLKKCGALIEIDGSMQLDRNRKNLLASDTTPGSIVTPLYDALTPGFREIIGIASVIGASFTVEDIESIKAMMDNNVPQKTGISIKDQIIKEDIFKFLGIYQLMLKKNRDQIHMHALQYQIQLCEANHSDLIEISNKEISWLVQVNYHLDRISSNSVQPDCFIKYKGMMLHYLYDRQMVFDAITIYEEIISFLKAHPTTSFSNTTRAKYAVMMADFYDIIGQDEKSYQCLQNAMLFACGWKLPETTFGKLGYIIRKLFTELRSIDYDRLSLATDFYALENPDDILVESINMRSLICTMNFDIPGLLASVMLCLSLKAAPLKKPINIYTLNLTSVYTYLSLFGAADVSASMNNMRGKIGKLLQGSYTLKPNLSNLVFLYWEILFARAYLKIDEAEHYCHVSCTMMEDLQILPNSRITVTSFLVLREILYVQGRFHELRPQIESFTSGLRYPMYSRQYYFAEEMAYRAEMMDLQGAQRNYEIVVKVCKESKPALLKFLLRDALQYELVMRVASIAYKAFVEKKPIEEGDEVVEELQASVKSYYLIDKTVSYGMAPRTLIVFRIVTMWIFFGQCTSLSRQLHGINTSQPHDPWGYRKTRKILIKVLKNSTGWLDLCPCDTNRELKTLVQAVQLLLDNKLNLAIAKWTEGLVYLTTIDSLKYFNLLAISRLTYLRIVILILGLINERKGKNSKELRNKVVPLPITDEISTLEEELKGYRNELCKYGEMAKLELCLMKSYCDLLVTTVVNVD
ncbi:hypothetical protein HDU76_003903 [Blyttiomyces sp. JEL0837]|nr:hypothetical protein HDU76_003903 [Blyttiomyces sp. JEL0837]